ncbi:carbonic anhydrase-like [Argiope bruennichi]|uniref:carbonic anhydrase-like n=1 Tax=Argiope bruennichi TaxID=94029 RepID=UPI0024952AAB|nr:carbonic anhydrase-like [Argiope bruennichi]
MATMHSTTYLLTASVLVLFFCGDGAVINCEADDEEPWSYHGKTNGPSAWGETYQDCYGSNQSPIAIKTAETVIDADTGKLQMKNYDVPITKATIVNNGHSAQITPKDDVARTIEVEGSVYTFQQLHFHWGSRYDQGSEHTLDGKRYALEAHFVHTNKENAIAVVGVFFQSSTHNSEGFEPIVEVLSDIPFKNDFTDLKSDLVLEELLPSNPSDYYHYDGSLTTPGCNEGVAWFILKGVMEMGEQQLAELRDLYSTTKDKDYAGCKLTDNYRPLQPLNDRVVIETSN